MFCQDYLVEFQSLELRVFMGLENMYLYIGHTCLVNNSKLDLTLMPENANEQATVHPFTRVLVAVTNAAASILVIPKNWVHLGNWANWKVGCWFS
jgi:hypothetical protein